MKRASSSEHDLIVVTCDSVLGEHRHEMIPEARNFPALLFGKPPVQAINGSAPEPVMELRVRKHP